MFANANQATRPLKRFESNSGRELETAARGGEEREGATAISASPSRARMSTKDEIW